MMKNKFLIITIGLVFMICSISFASIAAEDNNEQIVRIGDDTSRSPHFNPLWAHTRLERNVFRIMLPSLVWRDENRELTPYLAKEMHISEDAKTFTFYLPEEATWSDGEPLTAEDVKLGFEAALSPVVLGRGGGNSSLREFIVGADKYAAGEAEKIEGITVIDENTIQIDLVDGRIDFLLEIGGSQSYTTVALPSHILPDPLSEEFYEHDYIDNPYIVYGPYELREYAPDDLVHLEKRDDWWGDFSDSHWKDKPFHIDQVIVKYNTWDANMSELREGTLDLTWVRGDEVSDIEQLEHLEVESFPDTALYFLWFNFHRPVDLEIRQGVAYALDRQVFLDVLQDGAGEVQYSPIFFPEWAKNPNIQKYEYDTEKARELFEEADWDFENDELILLSKAEDVERTIAEIVQAMLGEIDVQVEIRMYDAGAWEQYYGGDQQDTFNIEIQQGGPFGVDPAASRPYLVSAGVWSDWMNWSNERVDELYIEGAQAPGMDAVEFRQDAYWEIQEILTDELPWLVIGQRALFWGKHVRLQGWEPPLIGNKSTWGIWNWHIEE